jgi:hypothetical protein
VNALAFGSAQHDGKRAESAEPRRFMSRVGYEECYRCPWSGQHLCPLAKHRRGRLLFVATEPILQLPADFREKLAIGVDFLRCEAVQGQVTRCDDPIVQFTRTEPCSGRRFIAGHCTEACRALTCSVAPHAFGRTFRLSGGRTTALYMGGGSQWHGYLT